MGTRGRIAVACFAALVAGVTGWLVLVLWVSSAGLYENTDPATRTEVLGGVAAFFLAVGGFACAVAGRAVAAAVLLAAPTVAAAWFLVAIL